jgi:hypothetical protein
MRGERNAHVSGEPDAKLLFSDRFMAWDHLEGRSYIVALCNVGSHDEQMAWIDSTETRWDPSVDLNAVHVSLPISQISDARDFPCVCVCVCVCVCSLFPYRLTALASSPSPSSSSSSPSSLFSPNAAGTTWGTSWGIDEPQGEMKGPGSIAFAPLPPSAPPPDPAPGRGPAGHMMGVSGGGEDDVSVSFRPGKTQGQYEEAVSTLPCLMMNIRWHALARPRTKTPWVHAHVSHYRPAPTSYHTHPPHHIIRTTHSLFAGARLPAADC